MPKNTKTTTTRTHAPQPEPIDPVLAELRAIRRENAEHAAKMERHAIAAVRGIALVERHVRTYLEAFAASADEDDESPAPNGRDHAG